MKLSFKDNNFLSKKSISEEDKAQQCLQVVFHPGIRHMVFMVNSAQVDIIDIDVCIVMSTIRLDLRSSYFVRVGTLYIHTGNSLSFYLLNSQLLNVQQ